MGKSPLDKHGQPANRAFNAQRIADRETDELIGLCHGMLSDRRINQEEADFLHEWLISKKAARAQWPGNVIHARVCEYLDDGVLDADEKIELFEFIAKVSNHSDTPLPVPTSTSLPFDLPMPDLLFDGTDFCLTGKFAYGTRKDCELLVRSLGGDLCSTPVKRGCTVVIGYLGSRDWIHSTHGRKIEAAIDYRDAGHPISIVSEDHWMQCYLNEVGL
ncbi:MAG: hypothetical protein JEY79_11030 [Pseudodesulfovibrio sp.]|nr:hypothetical protein [Pseudodesulfovibrio sp.]